MNLYVDFASAKLVQLVTIPEYIASRANALRGVSRVAEGRRIYQIILSLVLDNPFSIEAKQSFPLVEHDFGIRNLTAWAWELRSQWIPALPRADRNLFYSLKFRP